MEHPAHSLPYKRVWSCGDAQRRRLELSANDIKAALSVVPLPRWLYLPPCMWVTHCSRPRVSILSFRLSCNSLSHPSRPSTLESLHSTLLPFLCHSLSIVKKKIVLSRYRPSIVARLETVSLGIYLATFVERMLALARVQH